MFVCVLGEMHACVHTCLSVYVCMFACIGQRSMLGIFLNHLINLFSSIKNMYINVLASYISMYHVYT